MKYKILSIIFKIYIYILKKVSFLDKKQQKKYLIKNGNKQSVPSTRGLTPIQNGAVPPLPNPRSTTTLTNTMNAYSVPYKTTTTNYPENGLVGEDGEFITVLIVCTFFLHCKILVW